MRTVIGAIFQNDGRNNVTKDCLINKNAFGDICLRTIYKPRAIRAIGIFEYFLGFGYQTLLNVHSNVHLIIQYNVF